jgi:hypothetical protein
MDNLQRYGDKDLPAPEWLNVSAHLGSCRACSEEFEKLFPELTDVDTQVTLSVESFDEIGASHLEFEEHLRPYVDDEADAVIREIVESHVLVCTPCARELRDLREFKESLGYRATGPAAAASGHPWEKLSVWWRRLAHSTPARLFAVSLLLAMLTLGVWQFWRNHPSQSAAPETGAGNSAKATVPKTPSPDSAPIVQAEPQRNPNNESAVMKDWSVLDDGGQRIGLDEHGDLVGLKSLAPNLRQFVHQAITNQRLEFPATLAALMSRPGTMRGSRPESAVAVAFELLGPKGVIVRSDKPTFRWQTLAGAQSYVVKIYTRQYQEVIRSETLTSTEWSPSEPLLRGRAFLWQVTAARDGKEIVAPIAPTGETRFYVLSEEALDEANLIERSQPDSHLARGVTYASIGLLDDAAREFQELQRANPHSALANKLLQQVRETKSGSTR